MKHAGRRAVTWKQGLSVAFLRGGQFEFWTCCKINKNSATRDWQFPIIFPITKISLLDSLAVVRVCLHILQILTHTPYLYVL